MQKPARRPLVAFPRAQKFNELVQIDLLIYNNSVKILHMQDQFSKLSQAYVLPTKSSEDIIAGFIEKWGSIYGIPMKIQVDPESSLNSDYFCSYLEGLGVQHESCPVEAHFGSGGVERANAILENLIMKIHRENADMPFKQIVAWAVMIKNNLKITALGRSSNEIVFGDKFRRPDQENPNVPLPKLLEQHSKLQETAMKFIRSADAKERIRRALTRRYPGLVGDINMHDLVDFYDTKGKKWCGPYATVGHDPNKKKYYISRGARITGRHASHVRKHLAEASASVYYLDFDGGVYNEENAALAAADKEDVYVTEITGAEAAHEDFRKSDLSEVSSVKENGCLTPVKISTLPPDANIMGSRVVRIRKPPNDKAKSRWIIQGYSDNRETLPDPSAPVPKKESFRLILTIAAARRQPLRTFDIKTAYLQSNPLEAEVYLKPPRDKHVKKTIEEIFELKDLREHVFRLNKPLYGLNEAGRLWFETFVSHLKSLGLEQDQSDPCLWSIPPDAENPERDFLLIYVDDGVFQASSRMLDRIKKLSEKIKFGNLGDLDRFLGQPISRTANGEFEIDMNTYIKKIEPIPTKKGWKQTDKLTAEQVSTVRGKIGQLMWLAINKPTLACATTAIAMKINEMTVADLYEVNYIIRRLGKCNLKFINVFGNQKIQPGDLEKFGFELIGYTDASLANFGNHTQGGGLTAITGGNVRDRNKEVAVFRANMLSWWSSKLRRVCRSTFAAELFALDKTLDNLVFLKQLVGRYFPVKLTLVTDNQSLVDNFRSLKSTCTEKRLLLTIAQVKELVELHNIEVLHIVGDENPADALTKTRRFNGALKHFLTTNELNLPRK